MSADVHPEDITEAKAENLDAVRQFSVTKLARLRKFFLSDLIICLQKSDLTTKLWPLYLRI